MVHALSGRWAKQMAGLEDEPQDGLPVQTAYESRDVHIPDDFMTRDPPDAQPITVSVLDWTTTVLPEYDGRYAAVLDHVISPSECEALIQMAEDSVANRGPTGNRTWRPALVNIGGGWETLHKEYRNSDRIIWDKQIIMDRLWERCAKAPGVREKLAVIIEPASERLKEKGLQKDNRWEFSHFNERMRFLKYQGGQFFRRESPLDAHSCR
jgi:hypothetical protein